MKALRSALLALALAFGAVTQAHADPYTIVAAIVYAAGAEYVAIAIAIIGAYVAQSKAKRKARDAYNESLIDRIVTVRGANEPRRMVLGRQRVGGTVAFIGSTGTNKEQLVTVIALAAHECDAIEQIYFNDELVTIASEYVQTPPYARIDSPSYSDSFVGDGSTTAFTISRAPMAGTVTAVAKNGSGDSFESVVFGVVSVVGNVVTLSGPPLALWQVSIGYQTSVLTSYARVRTFLGGAGQTVDSVVESLFPGQWDSSHAMSGCAGLALFFQYNEDAFQTDVQVSAVMRGAKVYDPRLDSTAGGSGSQRVNSPSTWTWSENPALLIGYAAMSELCGRQPSTAIRWSDVAVAANVCDQQVDYALWHIATDENGNHLTDESNFQLLI